MVLFRTKAPLQCLDSIFHSQSPVPQKEFEPPPICFWEWFFISWKCFFFVAIESIFGFVLFCFVCIFQSFQRCKKIPWLLIQETFDRNAMWQRDFLKTFINTSSTSPLTNIWLTCYTTSYLQQSRIWLKTTIIYYSWTCSIVSKFLFLSVIT